MALTRLSKELIEFKYNSLDNMFAEPINDDMFHWRATIKGPPDGLFEGGVFNLDIVFPHNYPFNPPKYTVLTKMFHPNIASNGQVCMNILDYDWCPVLTIEKVLLSISSILDTPNMEEPINPNAAQCFQEDREKYNSIVRQYTLKYAMKSSTHSDNILSKL